MSLHFDLIVTADPATFSADLVLLDEHGTRLAGRRTHFGSIPASRQQALFDLQNFLRYYVERGGGAEATARTGVSIAEEVLGEEIFRLLWHAQNRRTLRVLLPGATEQENVLAAALARVPWEIARPSAAHPTLADRNLLVRVVHDMAAPATQPLELGADECLRVLFVFAQARTSKPLAARLEQNRLRLLLERNIYPNRRVVGHFLTHGVTRQRLAAQIAEHGGYHAVHWSGHGHLNRLVLSRPGGERDAITGEELLELFVDAGGFIPRLFFLSACHSGDILRVKSWSDFLSVARGDEPDGRRSAPPPSRDIPVEGAPGYTGTAHALLQGGVPSVVAMRYDVGDDYARELAVEFYTALLAHARPKSAAAALTMARRALLDPARPRAGHFTAADHATPVLYGEEEPGLVLRPGRSPSLQTTRRRLHETAELTMAAHAHFVGRTWELEGLGAEFIGSGTGAEVKPVAVITGLGGMGKTALAAEALGFWEDRFDWVLLYQHKGSPLDFENTLRDIHDKLDDELGRYHAHVQAHRADAVFRPAAEGFGGDGRLDRLTENLVRAMRDEAILLVLDNFETNLAPAGGTTASGEALRSCRDPAWDRFLRRLAAELVGTRSRVLVTCRHPLAALAGAPSHPVLLGPLPPGEAALYLGQHTGLNKMAFSADADEQALARRLLGASRFHPLLMDRLARLATAGAELRPQLLRGLETLESRGGFGALPELFAAARGDAAEVAYLDDALAVSLDQFIQDAGPDARRLLWIISLANEPVTVALVEGVWGGESLDQKQVRGLKEMLDGRDELPPELQALLGTMPAELRAGIEKSFPAVTQPADPIPLLRHLRVLGLVTSDGIGLNESDSTLSCHELVRERIGGWMCDHPSERGEQTERGIRLSYAEHLEVIFHGIEEQAISPLAAGSRALVYYVQAGEYERLLRFVGELIRGTEDSRVLQELLPYLEIAANAAPHEAVRWTCLGFLADALHNAGHPDLSLASYEQAALLVRAAAERGDERSRQAWTDLAWVTGNWGLALREVGDLEESTEKILLSIKAEVQAGRPAIHAISGELEALRNNILRGRLAETLPHVRSRLARVHLWWSEHLSGHEVPEAPERAYLADVLVGALDILGKAEISQRNWGPALDFVDAIYEVEVASNRSPEKLLQTRMNRAGLLIRLRRFEEAQSELESCLEALGHDPGRAQKVRSSLANLFYDMGDATHAVVQERRALSICDQLADPSDRAISHSNLGAYLKRTGTPEAMAEARLHQLAALIYFLATDSRQYLQPLLHNYRADFRRAHADESLFAIPRVSDVVDDPAFHALADWLRTHRMNVDELQISVDQLLNAIREKVVADLDAAQPGSA